MGRLGTPADIGNMVALLCSEEACWMTGQLLTVDGGASLMNPELPQAIQAGYERGAYKETIERRGEIYAVVTRRSGIAEQPCGAEIVEFNRDGASGLCVDRVALVRDTCGR